MKLISLAANKVKQLAFSTWGHRLNLAILTIMVVLVTFCIVWDFAVEEPSGNKEERWFVILEVVVDLSIVFEVLGRFFYMGKRFFSTSWMNYMDLCICILCLGTLALELNLLNEPNEELTESEAADMIRIARDITRILRLLLFMHWFQDSLVDFSETVSLLGPDQPRGMAVYTQWASPHPLAGQETALKYRITPPPKTPTPEPSEPTSDGTTPPEGNADPQADGAEVEEDMNALSEDIEEELNALSDVQSDEEDLSIAVLQAAAEHTALMSKHNSTNLLAEEARRNANQGAVVGLPHFSPYSSTSSLNALPADRPIVATPPMDALTMPAPIQVQLHPYSPSASYTQLYSPSMQLPLPSPPTVQQFDAPISPYSSTNLDNTLPIGRGPQFRMHSFEQSMDFADSDTRKLLSPVVEHEHDEHEEHV